MRISGDKSCLHFSNSQAFELNFGIMAIHEGPRALPHLSIPFHFIAALYVLPAVIDQAALCHSHLS
jgi:hypothetical protein